MLFHNKKEIRMKKKHRKKHHPLSLRILRLSGKTYHRGSRRYRLKNVSCHEGKISLSLDWVYLKNPLLTITLESIYGDSFSRYFRLERKIIYGTSTKYFQFYMNSHVKRLFPEICRQEYNIHLSLEGNLYDNLQTKVYYHLGKKKLRFTEKTPKINSVQYYLCIFFVFSIIINFFKI